MRMDVHNQDRWAGGGGRRGFTLIELLVVVIIVSVLAAIALPRFSDTREGAYFSSISSDFKNLAISQEEYWHVHQTYAVALADLGFNGSEGVEIQVTEATPGGWSAVGTHTGLAPDQGCAVYLGGAGAPSLPDGQAHTGGPGVVQCRR